MSAQSVLDVALTLRRILEKLGIDYLVGGSLASSVHGEPRSTNDVDLVAALDASNVDDLVRLLEADFYFDRGRIEKAVQERGSFNVIHLATMFKADIFVAGTDFASRSEMARRECYEVSPGETLWVASAEDTVLQKLTWYRLGNEVSDRQWRDVLAVLKVGAGSLDDSYLDEMAEHLDLAALLDRARREAGED